MPLKPWYKVVTPREDLREGRPLDASEFAVHLDHVREGRAPADYQDPSRFFERTFLTNNLETLAGGVVRRLSGNKVETSAVYNLTTQFGGGKTHALTLLYHLAKGGQTASSWKGVRSILESVGVTTVPEAATAVFVGTEFDAISGRGGTNGEPQRYTPWGEIAFQLSGAKGFAAVAQHDESRTAPSTEVIRQFIPKDRPVMILMDELLNFMGRNRKSGLTDQLYAFLQNLSEEARAQDRLVLVVSLPSLLDEMTADDESDYGRFQKLLDRLGKTMMMSAETETAEIIRRRLFEWGGLPDEGKKTAGDYAEWVNSHRQQVPQWFPVDNAKEAFSATYPFHPTLISVFERKWQALPRFQQTRGILRMLALWVSHAYQAGFKGAHKDPLIGMGTAPLSDPVFRSPVFEQLGGPRLEGAVTTDIGGTKGSHAVRLDKEAVESIKKARLHQKVATVIFFESNGGQTKTEATFPEIRLAVAEPDLDIGNVETALDALTDTCYFLSAEKTRYRFSLSPNLNKLLSDRRASIQPARVEERVRAEVQRVFREGNSLDRVFFPDKSNLIADRPVLSLVILSPEHSISDQAARAFVDTATREHGNSARTYKSALIWAVPEGPEVLRDEARKVLAWEDLADEQNELRLDEGQKRQLENNVKKAQRDIREAVWKTYKNIMLLGKDNTWKTEDFGLIHSSQAKTMVTLILDRLRQDDEIQEGVSPNFLSRNWSPAFKEWSTKAVRDAFFASPQFPRLLNGEAIKETIVRGVENGILAYVGKKPDGSYSPFHWETSLSILDIEISDDMFVIQREVAEAYKARLETPTPTESPAKPSPDIHPTPTPPEDSETTPTSPDRGPSVIGKFNWQGEIPSQKWMNFYTKVLSKFAAGMGLKLTLKVEVSSESGIPTQKIEETKMALRELGLDDQVVVDRDQKES